MIRSAHKFSSHRQAGGSMLLLCIATLGLIIAAAGLSFGVYFLFFSHKLLQNWTEDLSMQSAQLLNKNNHAGKLNSLIARSRENVFCSRALYRRVCDEQDMQELEPLAAQVMSQSRQGATLVIDDRKSFCEQTVADLRALLKDTERFKSVDLSSLQAVQPAITDVEIGSLDAEPSSVDASSCVKELCAYDESQNFVLRGREQSFYKAGINLQLPDEDRDLSFVLSPLPPAVKGVSAPLRMVARKSFKKLLTLRCDGVDTYDGGITGASAVRVNMTLMVKENAFGNFASQTSASCTACTGGASPEL